MADASGQRHRFRFFVAAPGTPGGRLPLSAVDARHVAVLRLADGAGVEVVDSTGTLWDATVHDATVALVEPRGGGIETATIELVAGALVGGRFDDLVDAAVQAGASRVVPFAAARRDLERLASRQARLQRIARAAAKQSRRVLVPEVAAPIDRQGLLALRGGILLDPEAPQLLDEVIRRSTTNDPLRLLVGPAEGLEAELVTSLAEAGWQRGRLGPTILRAELAAPVAVAIAAMHAPPR